MAGNAYGMTFEVRWTDIDLYRHMHNTVYSDFATHQRHAYLTEQGYPFSRLEEIGVGPVLFSENLQYLHEVQLGQALGFDLWLAGMAPDSSRWRLRHDAWCLPDGEEDGAERIHAAVITLEGSWFDLKERRLAPPPAELARVMESLSHHRDFEELRPLRRRK